MRRLRQVGGGALEQIAVFNTASESISCELRLRCAADFADLFEIKSGVRDRSASIVAAAGAGRRSLRFRYQVPGFLAETTIRIERCEIVDGSTEQVVAEVRPRIKGTDVVWTLDLPPRCSLLTLVKVGQREQGDVRANGREFRRATAAPRGAVERLAGAHSELRSENSLLTNVLRQSVVDLAALRVTGDLLGESYVLPAAGLPWFMTLLDGTR